MIHITHGSPWHYATISHHRNYDRAAYLTDTQIQDLADYATWINTTHPARTQTATVLAA